MKICETCNKEKKTRRGTIRVLTVRGWEQETLDMCAECIDLENATVRTRSKKAA